MCPLPHTTAPPQPRSVPSMPRRRTRVDRTAGGGLVPTTGRRPLPPCRGRGGQVWQRPHGLDRHAA